MGRPSDHPASSPGGGGWIDGATIQPSPPGEKAWNEIRSGFDRRPFMLDLLIVTRWTNYSKKRNPFLSKPVQVLIEDRLCWIDRLLRDGPAHEKNKQHFFKKCPF